MKTTRILSVSICLSIHRADIYLSINLSICLIGMLKSPWSRAQSYLLFNPPSLYLFFLIFIYLNIYLSIDTRYYSIYII